VNFQLTPAIECGIILSIAAVAIIIAQ